MIDHYWIIWITWGIAIASGIVAGATNLTFWQNSLGGCVSFGICLYIWWRKGKHDDRT